MTIIETEHCRRKAELQHVYEQEKSSLAKKTTSNEFVLEGLLHFACCENHAQKAIRYLKLKAKGNVKNFWFPHMSFAQSASDALVLNGRTETLAILMQYGLKIPKLEAFNRKVTIANWDRVRQRPSQVQIALYGGDVCMLQFLLSRGVGFDIQDLLWAYRTERPWNSYCCDSWNYLLKCYKSALTFAAEVDPDNVSSTNYGMVRWGLLDHALAYGNVQYLKQLFASNEYRLDVRLCKFKLSIATSDHDVALQDWSVQTKETLKEALKPWSSDRTQWFNATYNAKAEQARRAMNARGLEVEDCHSKVFSFIQRHRV